MSGGTDVVVGRQGIYSTEGIAGYALLFRSVGVLNNTPVTPDQMTAAVIFGAMSIGLSNLVGDRLMFCNADRGLITGEIPLLLPAHRTVFEVSDTVEVDDEIVRGCKRLAGD